MVTSLVRSEDAFTNEEIVEWLRRRLGDGVVDVVDEFETFTIVLTTDVWQDAARTLKEEPRLAFTMFDSLFGVDAGEEGIDVVAVLYSVETGRRVLLRTRADGGREQPSVPTLTGLFRGADFMERETWDMFGVEFEGHDSLAPRILSVENFEGWPLRKDFHLATREAKPWPGIKEPAETDEDGNIIEKIPGIGEAVGPMPLDEIMAEQARAANPELVAAQEAAEAGDADEAAGERTDAGHVDVAVHGAGSGGTAEIEEEVAEGGEMPGITDPDEQRARAAEHRADRARAIAQEGLVTGSGEGSEVPAGDPNAFEVHGSTPAKEAVGADTRGKDEIDVAAAVERGEIEPDTDAESLNEPVTGSMSEGLTTDAEKDGPNPRDEGPVRAEVPDAESGASNEAVGLSDVAAEADADDGEADEEEQS
jgi:NADH:ubiquinone oxidoreductase subunit C